MRNLLHVSVRDERPVGILMNSRWTSDTRSKEVSLFGAKTFQIVPEKGHSALNTPSSLYIDYDSRTLTIEHWHKICFIGNVP